ncbi:MULTISPECIES: hypothetical protein [unclassified Bacillus (in: firmicutes)]|uniref:hypothetical protein n=1 Tax=unclassified Bacillus (in: firmicutes) TaxID=185979 RepID=UPI0025B52D2E|nr:MULTISPECIES: hypothetical protein [unclassified Bacillus (in: firmicutes)]MDN0191207.1 hypothetical protein [Bacillus sp. B.PNR1]MDN3032113.1 hypothetical protein [Bacillus sp. B.PNR2]
MLEENTKALVRYHMELYSDIIDSLFQTAYSTNPEAFRLKDPLNIKIYVIKLSSILGDLNTLHLYLVLDKNKELDLEVIDLTNEKHYEEYSKFNTTSDFVLHILQKNGIFTKSDLIYHYNMSAIEDKLSECDLQEFLEFINAKTWRRNFYSNMLDLASFEGKSFIKHVNHPVSYYAKDAAKKYVYSLLDLKAIIEKVNDEDFSYQMDQAIAAYENSLYLASCATLGVCLETLCKLLLKDNGVKVKDSDGTMLDKLGERLREHNIISYKFKSRIDVCYKVRNLSSHTSPGKVLQGDCHFIIATINEIVDTYFK